MTPAPTPLTLDGFEALAEAARVDAIRHALRCAESGTRRERLHFHEHRTGALHKRTHGAAAGHVATIAEEQRRRVLDRNESRTDHPKHADLVDRSEPVLRSAQHAMVEGPVALKVQHRVDDMLEGFRAGNTAPLRDMSDHEHCRSRVLGKTHEARGTLTHLPHITRRALQQFGVHRLNRVDDQDADATSVRRWLRGGCQNGLQRRLREQRHRRCILGQTVGAQTHL